MGWSSSGARVGMARSERAPPPHGAAAALPTLVCVRPARAHTPASRHVWGVHAPGARGARSAPWPWPPVARRARPEGVKASRLAPPPPPLPPPAPVAASVAEIAAAGLVLAASASDGPGARRASPPPVSSGTPQQGAGGVLRCTGGGGGAQGDHGHGLLHARGLRTSSAAPSAVTRSRRSSTSLELEPAAAAAEDDPVGIGSEDEPTGTGSNEKPAAAGSDTPQL